MTPGEPRLEPSTGPRLRVETQLPDPPAAARVLLEGELDGEEVVLLTAELAAVPPDRDLELDASKLTFLDSAGIRCLLQLREKFLAAGGRVVIAAATHNVFRVLEISGLLEAFGLDGPA